MSIPLIGPDGREYTVDEADLPAVLKKGFRQTTPDAPQTLGEKASGLVTEALNVRDAGLLGMAQGATANLFGAVTGALLPEGTGAELKRLEDENPYASGLGQAAGMVFSPLGKLGGAISKSIGATSTVGKIAAAGAGEAVTGALFGAGKTLSDAALGDIPLTAEKLVAGTGLGAVLGLAGGTLGEAIGLGANAAAPLLKKGAGKLKTVLDDVANDATLQATRATQAEINKIGDNRLKAALETIRSRGHLESSPDDMVKALAKDREGTGQQLGKFLDDAEAAGLRPTYSKLGARLDEFEAALNPLERKAISSELTSAREALQELGTRPAGSVGKAGSGFRALDDLKQTIQAKAKFSRGQVPLDDVSFGLRRQLAGIFRDELDSQLLPQLGADLGKKFTNTKALYGSLKDAERLATSGAGRAEGFGLRDMAAAVIGSNLHPLGIAAAVGSRVMREQGPAIIARVADRLAKEPAIRAVAESFANALPSVAPKLGPYGAILAQQAALSPQRALAAHMAYAQVDPEYAATAQMAGLTPELPDEEDAAFAKATALTSVAARLQQQDDDVRRGIERVFKGKGAAEAPSAMKSQDFGSKRMRRDDLASHNKRVEEIRELAVSPEALVDRVAANLGGLGNVAPAVVAELTASANRAVQYLAKAAEVPPKAGPLAPEWVPTEAERYSFARKLETVQEPMSVFRYAAAGTLTQEQVDAFRAVYPRLAEQASDIALDMVAGTKGHVPYRSVLMLSLLTGADLDGSTSQAAIAANQQAIAAAADSQANPPPPPSDVKLGSAQRMALPEQRREMEVET